MVSCLHMLPGQALHEALRGGHSFAIYSAIGQGPALHTGTAMQGASDYTSTGEAGTRHACTCCPNRRCTRLCGAGASLGLAAPLGIALPSTPPWAFRRIFTGSCGSAALSAALPSCALWMALKSSPSTCKEPRDGHHPQQRAPAPVSNDWALELCFSSMAGNYICTVSMVMQIC